MLKLLLEMSQINYNLNQPSNITDISVHNPSIGHNNSQYNRSNHRMMDNGASYHEMLNNEGGIMPANESLGDQSYQGGSQQHQFSNASQVLHEAIIDLYLQVKVRSNDEVSTYLRNTR